MPKSLLRRLLHRSPHSRSVRHGPKTAQHRITGALNTIQALAGLVNASHIEGLLPATAAEADAIGDSLSLKVARKLGIVIDDRARREVIRAILLMRRLPKLGSGKDGDLRGMGLADLIQHLNGLTDYELWQAFWAFIPGDAALLGDFSNQAKWAPNLMTNPRAHRNNDFKYVVTSIKGIAHTDSHPPLNPIHTDTERNAYNARLAQLKNQYDPRNEGIVDEKVTATGQRSIIVKYYLPAFRDPSYVAGIFHSASLISDRRRATYTPYGFVLNAPAGNIMAASHQDLGYSNWSEDQLDELQKMLKKAGVEFTLPSPDELLGQTTGKFGLQHYNEVIVAGTYKGAVTVGAIFVKIHPSGTLYTTLAPPNQSLDMTTEVRDAILDLSHRMNIPIIAITDRGSLPGGPPVLAWFPNIIGFP